jgi:glutaredoxin
MTRRFPTRKSTFRRPRRCATLVQKTGEWTVPQIFVDGEYIGQDDELREWIKSGRLT